MTNIECDNLINNSLNDIFKNHKDSKEVINKLDGELDLHQKLILLSYYLKYKFVNKPDNEIEYKNEDSLPNIIKEIIPFIVHDTADTVYTYRKTSDSILIKNVIFEIYKLFELGKTRFNRTTITMTNDTYKTAMDFFKRILKDNGLLKRQ